MKITDGNKTIIITMQNWDGHNLTPDFSNDFFDGVTVVKDVDYCIEMAEDWANYRGDFADPEAQEANRICGIERIVDVTILD